MDFGCNATWMENTRGINLKKSTTNPGLCRLGADIVLMPGEAAYDAEKEYCPVFKGWTDQKLAECIRDWRTHMGFEPWYTTVEADRLTPQLPIKSSSVAPSDMFNIR